MFVNKKQNCS